MINKTVEQAFAEKKLKEQRELDRKRRMSDLQ